MTDTSLGSGSTRGIWGMRLLVIILVTLLSGTSFARPWHPGNKEDLVKLVADTLYLEAGGESSFGRLGVASVIWNRAKGSSLDRVILAKKQFSCWNSVSSPMRYRSPDNASYRHCVLVARDMVAGTFVPPRGFQGVMSYHEQSVSPYWRGHFQVVVQVDHHIFYQHKPAGSSKS